MATTTVDAPSIQGAIVDELEAIIARFGEVYHPLEDLALGLKDTELEPEVKWLLRGFLEDVTLDLRSMTEMALKLKAHVDGGLSQDDIALLEAVGGDFYADC